MHSLAWKPKIPEHLTKPDPEDRKPTKKIKPTVELVRKGSLIDWNNAGNIRLLEFYISKQKLSYRETAEELGIDFNIVYNAARKWDIRSTKKNAEKPPRKLSLEEQRVIIKLRSLLVTFDECAKAIGVSKSTLNAILKDNPQVEAAANRRRVNLIKEVMNE